MKDSGSAHLVNALPANVKALEATIRRLEQTVQDLHRVISRTEMQVQQVEEEVAVSQSLAGSKNDSLRADQEQIHLTGKRLEQEGD